MRWMPVVWVGLAAVGFAGVHWWPSHSSPRVAAPVPFQVSHASATSVPSGYGAPEALPSPASAATPVPAACQPFLPQGQAPTYRNARYQTQLTVVCYQGYVVGTSGLTRTGLWSAEYLDATRVAQARQMSRTNTFHPDPHVPAGQRAELSDYVRSGYDRGHLSPSGDQPNAQAQDESFSLANMAPQAGPFNRGPWERLEEAVRNQAQRTPVWVITGVLFEGNTVGFLKQRVAVPTLFYKVVYAPSLGQGAVYWGLNTDAATVNMTPLAAFEQAKGLDFHIGAVQPLTLVLPAGRRFNRED